MSTDRQRYARVHAILADARVLTGAELEAHLTEACDGDATLRAEVRELLEAGRGDEAHDPFAEARLAGARVALEGALEAMTPDWLPEKIGGYTIRRQIGRGGMGVVYEAEQASPQRRVAIKLLHPLHETAERLRRFRHEAAMLGRLQHPGIAQIFEASTYDIGRGPQPFFAMELVEGVDIRTYCERNDLDQAARIELLARVADAVHHAHEHGIIHRDLKPDNVLVDARGHPRILDFGIAHANEHSTSLSSIRTEEGQIVGTLAYMAPEQLKETGRGLTARVDVFALGVLGFELLLGRLPRQIEDLPLPQVISLLSENDAPRAGTLDASLRGDVETILGKALETDPGRRYDSAAAFAGDLRRHLANQPIHAHPPSTLYLVHKFVRRHRALVLGGATTLLVAIAGAIIATGFAIDATKRTSELLQLSLAQDLEDLMASADGLWPPHPQQIDALGAWLTRARALNAELPSLIAKRDELRSLALPRSEEERQAERESHPAFAELERVEGELAFRRRALAQRKSGTAAALPEVDWSAEPESAATLAARARQLVDPARTTFGDEPLGLVLAERALERASDAERSEIATTLAQASFALGRDEDALALAFVAVEEAPDDVRAAREAALVALEEAAEDERSEDGLAAAAERIASLDARARELAAQVEERRLWAFTDETEESSRARWWHSQLSELIVELEALNKSGAGLLTEDGVSQEHGWSIPRRLACARRLESRFAAGGEYARRWETALPAIRETYPGLELTPQPGLVPIGADPESRLWEFWHVQSGPEPVRAADGGLVLEVDSGPVFVLLPGGRFWMGAQPRDPTGRNHDPQSVSNEWPVHEVVLSPFFLSKYEMTQAQWERMTGGNPSRWTEETFNGWIAGPNPVEHLTWLEAMTVTRRMGTTLPSEAQWEYACRAGTSTPVPFAFEDFATHANIADRAFERAFGRGAIEPWDDGLGGHAPVGSLAPNAFGLHDMIGNLWEWCLDGYDPTFYRRSPLTDPVNPPAASQTRVPRGGSFFGTNNSSRSSSRSVNTPSDADDRLGLRPALAVRAEPGS